MWYIGTINNDDSTFMVTDKVYDRAMPIDINDKGKVFEPIDTEALDINYSYLDKLFRTSIDANPLSQEMLDKIEKMDDYVIQHFRIAFGNRIVAHMKKFVPVYVACGGEEVSGVDYFVARKILRKFEQLNLSYIRDLIGKCNIDYEMEYTLPIFENESNVKENIKRESLLKEVKLQGKKDDSKPVLLLLLQDKLNRPENVVTGLNASKGASDRYDFNNFGSQMRELSNK